MAFLGSVIEEVLQVTYIGKERLAVVFASFISRKSFGFVPHTVGVIMLIGLAYRFPSPQIGLHGQFGAYRCGGRCT